MPFSVDEWLAERFSEAKYGPEDLHWYQRDIAIPFLLDNPFSALFVDLGLGKTVMSLTVLAELHAREAFNKALIIAPLRVINQTWPTEFKTWRQSVPLRFTHIRDDEIAEFVRQAKRDAKRSAELWAAIRQLNISLGVKGARELRKHETQEHIRRARIKASRTEILRADARTPVDIHLINREQTEFLANAWGKRWPYDTVIIDESSAYKSHDSQRFKALKMMRPYIRRMHQLTATPVSENYEGLFAQIFLLDGGERFGRGVTAFREKYFQENPYTHKRTLLPGAAEQIAEKISDITLVMKAEDYLPMDKPLVIPRRVKMTPDQRKAYKRFEREFFFDLPSGEEIEAKTAASLSGKLLQLASGAVYDQDKQTHFVHDHKIEELQQIQEEARGRPLLVAYWYQSSLARLVKAFPKAVVMDKAGKAVDQWTAGKIPLLLVHPASSGHGLNLQYGGHLLAFFDIPWSLELYSQLIGRLARQGQKHIVRVFPIIAEGTLDELVLARLAEKRDAQEFLFQKLKELRGLAIKRNTM